MSSNIISKVANKSKSNASNRLTKGILIGNGTIVSGKEIFHGGSLYIENDTIKKVFRTPTESKEFLSGTFSI